MNCPKCSEPIKWYELSPNCKKCGVHIMYYTQESDLIRDAKRTELEFASARVLVAKLKANFIGGKYAIARLVFMFLCVGSLCIPFGDFSAVFPFRTIDLSVGGIGIYSLISGGLYNHFFDFLNVGIAHDSVIKILAGFVMFALIVLMTLIIFVTLILSFINKTKGAKKIFIMTVITMVIDIICTVWMFIAGSSVKAYDFLSFKAGFGGFAALIIFGVFAALNLIIYKKDEQPKVKEVDLQRIDIRKRIKAGEIDIDELSMPIFETEEERLARENAFSGKKKEKKKKTKKGEKADE